MASAQENMDQFTQTWTSPSGFPGWLSVVNNQPLGKRFMVTAFSFFLVGGVLALLIRIQLAVPENDFLGPKVYNQLFSMHGSTMMYLFAVPFLEGLAIYLLPLMIGSRDLAFPRLTAFGYWAYLFGGLIFYASFVVGAVPDAGWFAYTPLSGPRYSGSGLDVWALGLGLVEIAGITAGAEIVVTILKLRAPGMSLGRMPLFAWTTLAAGIMILFAFTTLLVATLLLELDRTAGTHFFNTHRGGNSLLWQHLFWFFGHPEVYIIFLPATGIVSMVVTAFAGRILGYMLITVAILVTAFVSFGLWVHHMYTTGLPHLSMNFFAAASLMIALASGTQVFAWIASLWGRAPAMKAPLLFVLGFLITFVMGGMTGVMIAIVPFDWQVHDTFFIVAHFHYVLIGGAVFPVMAGLYYWLPKITGRMLHPALGMWSFGLTFLGFHLTFFPMHVLGFFGMPRRVYTYPTSLGIDGYNAAATVGAFILALGFVVFVVDFLLSLWRGSPAGENPWGGDSLEWSVESPPPVYSFSRPPEVGSRHPAWEEADASAPDEGTDRAIAALTASPSEWRATLVTDALWARPQAIQHLPGPSFQPLFVAIGLALGAVALLGSYYILAIAGAIFATGSLIRWLWPTASIVDMLRRSDLDERAVLPIFSTGSRSVPWWGAVCLITVLATVLAVLLYSYFYIRLYSSTWPQDDLSRPDLLLPLLTFGLLAAAAGVQYWAERSYRQGEPVQFQLSLAGLIASGLLVLALQGYTFNQVEFTPRTNAYASLVWTMSGYLWLLVVVGLGLAVAALVRSWTERSPREGVLALQLQVTSLYWYFVAAAGVLLFAAIYISPYVL